MGRYLSEIVGSLVPLGMGTRVRDFQASTMPQDGAEQRSNGTEKGRKSMYYMIRDEIGSIGFTTPDMRKGTNNTLLGDHNPIKIILRERCCKGSEK